MVIMHMVEIQMVEEVDILGTEETIEEEVVVIIVMVAVMVELEQVMEMGEEEMLVLELVEEDMYVIVVQLVSV